MTIFDEDFNSFFRRIHQYESFAHFETSLIIDAFVMSLVNEHRRRNTPLVAFTLEQILERSPTPFLIAKCAECSIRKELGKTLDIPIDWKSSFC